jgi:hypothetical protein
MSEYRIIEHPGLGFEPQMQYTAGRVDGQFWYPLNESGYWVEPDAFSDGNPTRRIVFDSRADAERVLTRARAVNQEHIREAEATT